MHVALERAANAAPNAVAVEAGDTELSYAELAERVAGVARQLRAAGAKPGDRVAIFLDKTIDCVIALFGTWAAGNVAVPVNERLRSRQVKYILEHSGSRILVSHKRKLRAITLDPDSSPTLLEVESPAGAADGERARGAERDPSANAAILYTSGSTGAPKGILLSHDNLEAGARIVSEYLGITHHDRLLSVLPFSFDYGLNQLLSSVYSGARVILQRSTLPADVCRTLERREITGFAGVPPLWVQLAAPDTSPFFRLRFPKLRYLTNSGGVFPVELVRRYSEQLPGASIFLMYGLTEAFRSTYLPPDQLDARPSSMGRAIPETEVMVVNDAGELCGSDEVGELVHRGPTVAKGYWRDPEASAAVFRSDTLPGGNPEQYVVYSGDLVRRDAEGFLYFMGRRDQMIKSQGYRISPEEVEEIVFESGLVREVVAKGEADDAAGQVVVLHCVAADPARFSEAALLEHCNREMPRYMVPQRIAIHADLPRTASGKVDRKAVGT